MTFSKTPGSILKDFLVKKYQRIECLILSAGRHIIFHGKMSEELTDFFCAHLFRMTFLMEKDVSFHPVDIGDFCSERIMRGSKQSRT